MPSSKYSFGTSPTGHEVTLPSRQDPKEPDSPHNVCLVRRLMPQDMIRLGLLDAMDQVTAKVGERHLGSKNGVKLPSQQEIEDMSEEEALAFLVRHKTTITGAMDMVDRIFEAAVIEPPVLRPVKRDSNGVPIVDERGEEIPLDTADRQSDVFYTDQVDMADKNAVMEFTMSGVRAVEPFRGKHRKRVGGMEQR